MVEIRKGSKEMMIEKMKNLEITKLPSNI